MSACGLIFAMTRSITPATVGRRLCPFDYRIRFRDPEYGVELSVQAVDALG